MYKIFILKTIQAEGVYSDEKFDDGGETKYGISKKSYPNEDIKNLTLERAIEIYKRDYYDKLPINKIEDIKIAWKLFDMCVNFGILEGTKILQRALGVKDDGIIGKITLTAINNANYNELMIKIIKEQVKKYTTIVKNNPNKIKFLNGWIERAFKT